ncbi:MAG: glycosyl hydrolase family 8 [Treponema sp.]|nr:glycosyl hydrolase family 8 [Treponema sp.]
MEKIAVLFAAVTCFLLIVGCATGEGRDAVAIVEPRFPFPQRAFDQFAIAPMMPSNRTQEEIDNMILDLFRRILRNDLIVDSTAPQTREDFRMVFRHIQPWEVQQGNVSHITTSESHGYGMIILAYMAGSERSLGLFPNEWIFGGNLKDYFNAMLRTVLAFPSDRSTMMSWRLFGYRDAGQATAGLISWNGYRMLGGLRTAPFTRTQHGWGNSATDGDMDIIYALILADRQWGSDGRYDYIGIARQMLAELWRHCVHPQYRTLLLGDWARVSSDLVLRNATRTSDFITSHLNVFREVDPAHDWQAVIDATHDVIREIRDAQNALGNRNGLLPDFVVREARSWAIPAGQVLESPHDGAYSFNAVRVPWRLGTAYMLFGNTAIGDSTLYDYSIRPLDDFARAFHGNHGLGVIGPLAMNGTRLHAWTDSPLFGPPFALTAALVGYSQQWIDSFWGNALPGGLNEYRGDTYGDYIRLIVLLTLTGNYWCPTWVR